MKIVEYDDADPVGVLHLNLLSLNWPLTPELSARIRRLDPRPFPFFGVYAMVDSIITGQMLVTEVIHSPFAKLLEWTPSSGYCHLHILPWARAALGLVVVGSEGWLTHSAHSAVTMALVVYKNFVGVIHNRLSRQTGKMPTSTPGSARGLFSIIESAVQSGIRPLLESSGSNNLFYSLTGVNFTQN